MSEKDAFEGSRITSINQMPYSQEMVEAFINICTVKVVDVRLMENDDIETTGKKKLTPADWCWTCLLSLCWAAYGKGLN